MPITLNCPKCHKPFRVRDESIGGKVRCPSCGSVLQVPGALAPASHFGDEPKDGGARPVAEEVPPGGSKTGAAPAGRPEGAVDLNQPPSFAAGPPSIRGPVATGPARAPVTLPPAPQRVEPQRSPVRLPADVDPGWSRVHGGLGMIWWALMLCAFVFVALFGHGLWATVDPDGALKPAPGFLGKDDWPRWKELMVAYTAGPLGLAALLLLLGRLRCVGAPAEAHGRGLAFGSLFFTLIGLAGIGFLVATIGFNLQDKLGLPDVLRRPAGELGFFAKRHDLSVAEATALYAAVPAAVLADLLTLLFLGQIGWPLGRPRLQKSVAGVFGYATIVPAGILIGHLFYPAYEMARESIRQSGSPLGAGEESELAKRVLIWSVVVLAAGMLFFLRYAAVVGVARRTIRKRLAGEA